jgi:hypothetical protein
MIMIKMQMDDDSVKELEARRVLAHVNATEPIMVLNGSDWGKTGPYNFLTGKENMTLAIIAEPLSHEDAIQAVNEYYEFLGSDKKCFVQ